MATTRAVVAIDVDDHVMRTALRLGSSTYVTAIVDTGASLTSIPTPVANELVAKGEAEYAGSGTFTLADGTTHQKPILRIKSVQLGGLTLHDVLASAAPDGADVLLGSNALDQLGMMTIDKAHGRVLFG
jgi:predicted aspartyl protease